MEPYPRMLLWTPAFLVAGVACGFNAARCGRLHCYFTGPLFLLAAVASVLVGMAWVSFGWNWIGNGVAIGWAVAFLPECVRGKYRTTS